MSEFGKTLDESNKRPSTKAKYGSDFIKIGSEHQTVIRVLDAKPEVSWSHFVPKGHHAFPNANAGKGMSFMCPGWDTCPICAWNKEQKKGDPKTKDVLNARKVYTFNVLDRTPVVTCPSCEAEHYESGNAYPSECECGADLSGVTPAPRNKLQIMQKGKRIIDQFKSFEEEPELGDLKEYDIKLDTRGKGSESMTTCVPKQKSKLDLKKLVGEDWQSKLYDCKQIVAPLPAEAITRILNGEDYYTVLKKDNKDTE
jgi:hypothetical protein